ncbi:alanine--tRNA ligase [Candidatus Wolfebacteria bacterium]|nr:alanine--tRNA ligase [Candidatus Wolfebacteria bacterium]
MQSKEIRERFLKFFERRGHAIVPSASLIPENDPTTLFTTAGMQPLVPYLLGEKHPKGNRLVNVQKCLRTDDIDEVGDNTHLTFFEMLGNWSLGDSDAKGGVGAGYFKKEALAWSYEFLTSQEEGLGLDPARLYVTVFAGDDPSTPESLRTGAPRDEESAEIWKSIGIPEHRVYYRGAEDNWWSPGENGPCGPDSEMFYDITTQGLGDLSPEEFQKADDNQQVVEIWNDVFMEYEKENGKVIGKLKQKNVDTGAGLERIAAVMQKTDNVFDTDLFKPLLRAIEEKAYEYDIRSSRIVADHLRAAVFLISDGIIPSNTDRGYVLRRLIRRAVRHMDTLGFADTKLSEFVSTIADIYGKTYSNVLKNIGIVQKTLDDEENKFEATLKKGLSMLNKIFTRVTGLKQYEDGEDIPIHQPFSGKELFELFSTYGFPIELSIEIYDEKRKGILLSPLTDVQKRKILRGFDLENRKHQELSRTASAGKFKGGLADHSDATVKLHTAHHLLLAALQKVLGKEVKQRGSNITPERLRIDFTFDRKLTDEEKQKVEEIVNEWITAGLAVVRREMPREEAEKLGAEMEFGTKYPDVVSVYIIQDAEGSIFSIEFCGGPHVSNTSELGNFKILKEEASSAGVRRIKATLE